MKKTMVLLNGEGHYDSIINSTLVFEEKLLQVNIKYNHNLKFLLFNNIITYLLYL